MPPQGCREVACVKITCPVSGQPIDVVTVVQPGATATGSCDWERCPSGLGEWPVYNPDTTPLKEVSPALFQVVPGGVATVTIEQDGSEPTGQAKISCDLLPGGGITEAFSVTVIKL